MPDPGLAASRRSRTAVGPIVVIEDDPSSAELVAVHLAAAGLRPVNVRTGEEGLAAIAALRPAAVVLDIHLPGMDGWDVLSAIKADPQIASTPVVVVSVLPERGRGFALGALGLPREARVEGGTARGGVARGRRAASTERATAVTSSSSTTTRPRSSWSGPPWSLGAGP